MKKILLIEDNKDVRENTAEILELANYKVSTAENGKTGIEKAYRDHPDLIICDIMMPVLDGYGVLHLLSKNKETAYIPFIFLTARTDRSDMRKGMEMGADDYITKPFDDIELLNAVEARLKKSEAFQKDFANNAAGFNEFMDAVKQTTHVDLRSEDNEVRSYKKKELIYAADKKPAYLFFLEKGKVKTFRSNEDGKEFINNLLKEGDFFGHIPLIEESLYAESAEALDDCEVMLIPKKDFFELLYSDRAIATRFIRMLANSLSEKEETLLKLAYNSVRKRVADGLLLVYDRYKKSKDDRQVIQITREDLANVVGTATESLIRTLSDFKSEKLIEIKEGKISILNEEKLKNMFN